MRFSLALLPFVAAAVALPVSQPVVRGPADLIDLPELGTILGGLPKLDVSEVIAELNTTLHGALPELSPTVVAQIQSIFDTIQGGSQLTGNHGINSGFAEKAAGFNWGHGDHGHGEGGMGGGDYDIPPWLLELLGKLIDLLGQLGGGPVQVPPGGPLPPTEIPTTIPMPPTEVPFPTDLPTDGPFPPTVTTTVSETNTDLPIPTVDPTEIATVDLPTDELPTDPVPTDDPTDTASTDLPTEIETIDDPSSTLAPEPTATTTLPTVPLPSETDAEEASQ